jgi:hypothetical protein
MFFTDPRVTVASPSAEIIEYSFDVLRTAGVYRAENLENNPNERNRLISSDTCVSDKIVAPSDKTLSRKL